jgi:hypothetical protein
LQYIPESDIQTEAEQAVISNRILLEKEVDAMFRPAAKTLIDPVVGPFPEESADMDVSSYDHASVILPCCIPTDTTIGKLRGRKLPGKIPVPELCLHVTVESETHKLEIEDEPAMILTWPVE